MHTYMKLHLHVVLLAETRILLARLKKGEKNAAFIGETLNVLFNLTLFTTALLYVSLTETKSVTVVPRGNSINTDANGMQNFSNY